MRPWFNLTGLTVEEALCDKFRHWLEQHRLGQVLFNEVARHLETASSQAIRHRFVGRCCRKREFHFID